MERAAPLVLVLLCAAFFIAVASAAASAGASAASIFPPFLVPHGGSASAAPSAAQAKPLVWKGKTVIKYMTHLRPTKLKGKLVGDKLASGKYVAKVIRYSATVYYLEYILSALNIKSGGKEPITKQGFSCTDTVIARPGPTWKNVTSDESGRRGRYSFVYTTMPGPLSLAMACSRLETAYRTYGSYFRVVDESNNLVLCGKIKKVKG